jgi:CheY-like chemotaxis protein
MNLLLADDDNDDCLLFEEALQELMLPARLAVVHDGENLMRRLAQKTEQLPDILFLDLNLPRKNGIECLSEIKHNQDLAKLFVVIFSTSSEAKLVNQLYENGAQYYIRKPTEFSQLKKVIHQALGILEEWPVRSTGRSGSPAQPPKENFVLTGDL